MLADGDMLLHDLQLIPVPQQQFHFPSLARCRNCCSIVLTR